MSPAPVCVLLLALGVANLSPQDRDRVEELLQQSNAEPPGQALDTVREAEAIARELGDRTLVARCDRFRADILSLHVVQLEDEGKTTEALAASRECEEVAERIGDPGLALFCAFHAGGLLRRLDRFDEALAQLDRALDHLARVRDEPPPAGESREDRALREATLDSYEAECEAVRGDILRRLARPREAEESLLRAIELNGRLDPGREAANLNDLGLVYFDQGRFADAVSQYRRAIEIAEREREDAALLENAGDWRLEPIQQIRIARMQLAQVHEKTGEYERALDVYRELLEQEGLPPALETELRSSLGRILRFELDDPERALRQYERAEELARAIGSTVEQSNAFLHQGDAKMRLEDPGGALPLFERALDLSRAAGDRRETLFDLIYLARCLRALDRLEDARGTCEEAVHIARQNDFREAEWLALSALADVLRDLGDEAAARARLVEAIEVIEEVRTHHVEEDARILFFADHQDVYASLLDLLLAHDEDPDRSTVARAFQILQRSRARDLLDRLGAHPVDLDTIQREVLAPAEALVEYVATPRGLIAFVVTPESARARRLASRGATTPGELADRVGQARRECLSPRSTPEMRPALRDLARELLGPWITGLRRETRRLVVVPDGPLAVLPFAALPLEDAGRPYLVERFELEIAASGSALAALRRLERASPDLDLLAFGDPVLPAAADDESLEEAGTLALLVRRHRLRPLPASAQELERIARAVDGESVIHAGTDATLPRFRSLVGSRRPRAVHLATHSLVDRRNPGASAVLFSPGTDADEGAGVLRAEAIPALSVPAALVTLSSCQSAQGTWVRGEGVLGLARSFLIGGAASVACTLWKVDDATSASFMEQFYDRLGRGRASARALREAQLAFLDHPETAHPRHWASYVVVGDGRARVFPAPAPTYPSWVETALALGLALAALAVAVPLLRRRRSS